MSVYSSLRFRITSVSGLLHHNGQLADPLNAHARAIAQVASKRKKTQADHEQLARLEYVGSLYMFGGRPCIPAEAMEAALAKAASLERRGSKAKAGLVVRRNLPLEYEGPTDPEQLATDERFRLRCAVRIGANRVMRTRPLFDRWRAELVVDYHPGLLDARDVLRFLVTAGEQVGVCDWRPRFGRFAVEEGATNETQM